MSKSKTKKMQPAILVAVHVIPYVTRAGHQSSRFSQYFVAAGPNPRGPHGGRCGRMTDGKKMSPFFSKREKAEQFAEQYASENGARI